MNDLLDKASLPDPAVNGKPVRDPVVWFGPIGPWRTVASVRESRAPLNPGSHAVCPLRVDPAEVQPGDWFGCRVVVSISCAECRLHGVPCHCTFWTHTVPGCGYDNPVCPCYGFRMSWRAVCRCACGIVKEVSLGALCSGLCLSCGTRECIGGDDA
jgi:hypothetical protein